MNDPTAPIRRRDLERTARNLARDLAPVGRVTIASRLDGFSLLEDDVMFGHIDATGTPYLRTTTRTAQRFHALGASKHPEMPYWSVPPAALADTRLFLELAYEAADVAHIVFSFAA